MSMKRLVLLDAGKFEQIEDALIVRVKPPEHEKERQSSLLQFNLLGFLADNHGEILRAQISLLVEDRCIVSEQVGA